MNVKNILVPVDYSHSGDAAIAYAVSLGKEYEAEIHFVHVCEPPYVDGGFAGTPGADQVPPAEIREAETQLESIMPSGDVRCRRKVLIGTPADELVGYAKDNSIDLVVMGTHGRSGLGRLLMGSVAEGVVRRSPCPVLTIKQPSDKLQES